MNENQEDRPLTLAGKLSAQERIRIGDALSTLTQMEGWKLFVEFLHRRKADIAIAALDDARPRDYFKGRVEELSEIISGVEELIQEGAREVRSAKTAQGIVFSHRFGSGDDAATVGDESLFTPGIIP
jgi:hypothetical protein